MTNPVVLHSEEEIRQWATSLHEAGETIALVPTMGNLHEGHFSLVKLAKARADHVVVSIFVNPTQFGEGEDFDRYPRTLEADIGSLSSVGVVVFAPSVETVYPPALEIEQIFAGPIGDVLEGAIRPGHFDGVLTVCNRLFDLTSSDVAVFGEKDAQQLFLVTEMVARLGLPVRIVPGPIIRSEAGLALSSRNAYLSAEGLKTALALPESLRAISSRVRGGESVVDAVSSAQLVLASDPGLGLDYLEALDAQTFEPWTNESTGECVVVGAVVVEGTRLLDNVRLKP
jgi:pantoate--beta-alanine ligase